MFRNVPGCSMFRVLSTALTISYETWFTGATLIEIGITEVDVHVLVNVPRRIECVSCYFDFNTKKILSPSFCFAITTL